MKKVMASGTFDMLHKGHEYFLKRARAAGDYLVVNVALDETVEKVKGRKPEHSLKQRMDAVERLGIADEVLHGYPDDPYRIVKEVMPDIICLGYDQHFFTKSLKTLLKQLGIDAEIIRISPFKPEKYKTSLLRCR